MDDRTRLVGWKQIAAYLGKGENAVQRWEREEGLPIHRLPHARGGQSVFAYTHELDSWLAARAQPPSPRSREPVSSILGAGQRAAALIKPAIFAVIVLGTILWWNPVRWSAGAPTTASVPPRALASDVEPELSPSLSPDGLQVVYARRDKKRTELFVKAVAGGSAQPLAMPAEAGLPSAGYPAWSPRGDLIAFLSREGAASFGLFLVSPRGGMPRRLTGISGVGICWLPAGDRIAFADRRSPGEPFAIFSMPIAGGTPHRLTTPPPSSFGDTFCSFSPDSRKLAIVRHPTRHEANVHIVPIENADATTSKQLSDSINGITGIAWSPDGESIVAGASHGLWRIPATGSGKPALVAGLEGGAAYPSFSRGAAGAATRLVYQSHYRDVNVWRWTSSQGSVQRVTNSTWWDDLPALVPDGSRLAYLSNQTGATEVWLSEADGSNPRKLTSGLGHLLLSPQWSPDGRHVAFSATVAGNRDIYVIGADGTGIRRVTHDAGEEGNPAWSRDGRWIYFRSDQDGTAKIWKIPSAGGTAVHVTDGEAFQVAESYDGKQLYFVRNVPAVGLWTMPAGGGAATLLIPGVHEGYWGVTDRGIMYIPSELGLPDGSFEIRFFDTAARTESVVVRPRARLMPLTPGFAVSRDGRSIYWTQVDDDRDDVMMIESWNR